MPGMDGTGPLGAGPGTGRGLGACGAGTRLFAGAGPRGGARFRGWGGFGFGRGWRPGRNAFRGCWGAVNRENLKAYQEYLESELKAVRSYIADEKQD
ncbi:MAG: DUF5320 domain-containing protein [Syntrophomonadaceae bacterium]|nr:DUF5320 domain-containing protein [Syntrophomonadaceae bacterium]